jgi:lysozyme
MAIVSPIFKSTIESRKTLSESKEGIKKLTTLLEKRQKVKREAYAKTNLFRQKRENNDRRQQLEDELEAPKIVVQPGGPAKLIQKDNDRGFFDRILGFIGYLAAGWIMNNLPTWIGMGKEFIARLKRAGEIVSGFFGDTVKLFTGFGNLLSAASENLMRFDFFDTSNRIKNAMQALNFTVGDMGNKIEEAYGLATTPLTEGKYSGEDIPGLGTQQTNEGAYEEPAPYSGSGAGSGASTGTKEQRAMLDAIAFAEGTRDQPNNGYKTLFGFGQFDDYSRHPDKVVRSGRYASAAAGRYQFMPGTFNRLAKKLGLKDFSPASQDKAAIELAREYGVTQELLVKEGMSPRVSALLGRQWASFPGKTIGLDQPTQKLKSVQQAYQKSLGSTQQQSQIQQVPVGNVNPTIGDRLGAGRGHKGVDLQVEMGTPLRAVSDGVIVDSDFEKGWGNFLVMKDDRGIYHLYGHMQSGYKKGGPVKKGEVIGKVGMTGRASGPHLHWETGTGWNKSQITGRFDALSKYSKFAPFNTQPGPGVVSQTPAQIAAAPRQSQSVPSTITPERRGQDIIIAQPRNQQQIVSTSSGGGGEQAPSPINEFDLLNNFIKNKLLLDLAYL